MLTLKEAAEFVARWLERDKFPESTIRSWIFLKRLPAVSVGRARYIHQTDLEKILPAKHLSDRLVGCKRGTA